MKIVFALVLVLLFLTGCVTNLFEVPGEKYCETDADCVPAACCHPDSCINIENAPDCSGIICTMACISVLDCNQGKCVCKDNICSVKIIEE